MIALSVICALATGRMDAVASAALEGAADAVQLCLSMTGALCLWMGVMEIMSRSGLSAALSKLLRPILKRLYPDFARNDKVMDTVAANVSANLLGLGNAATPLGMEAARLMARKSPGVASNSLCMLVVCNTASIQLIPTTVAAVRAAAGCATPFDILPAVWLASAAALSVGILAAKALEKLPSQSASLTAPPKGSLLTSPYAAQPSATKERYGCGVPLAGRRGGAAAGGDEEGGG